VVVELKHRPPAGMIAEGKPQWRDRTIAEPPNATHKATATTVSG
jgi:hypothetical protein